MAWLIFLKIKTIPSPNPQEVHHLSTTEHGNLRRPCLQALEWAAWLMESMVLPRSLSFLEFSRFLEPQYWPILGITTWQTAKGDEVSVNICQRLLEVLVVGHVKIFWAVCSWHLKCRAARNCKRLQVKKTPCKVRPPQLCLLVKPID